MTPYTEDEDIEHYLTTYERIAFANQWPRECWALYLVPLLSGKARAAYVAMDILDTRDYAKVKQAILAKYEIDPEAYRHRFRSMDFLEDETARELQSRLTDLYKKWICPAEKSKEQIGDVIVLEQFLRMLSPELRVWVKEHNPESSKQAADLAEAFTAARRHQKGYQLGIQEPTNRRTHGTPWDYDRKPSGKAVGGGRVFRRSSSPNSRPHQPSKPLPKIICHNCGQPGHIKPQCPLAHNSEARLCYTPCDGSNKATPSSMDALVPVRIRGKIWKALIDSGSSQTFIRGACLGEEGLVGAGSVKVRCIHGDESEHQTADVQVEIEGQTYLLNVGIMDNCPYPVVLGQDVPVLADLLQQHLPQVKGYVLTRAQAKANPKEVDLWQELPFPVGSSGGRDKKPKSVKRREKVLGTPVQEQLPMPPLDVSMVDVTNFGQAQKEDATLITCFNRVRNEEDVSRAALCGKECFVLRGGRLVRISAEGEQLVVPKPLRAKVLNLAHNIPWSGHLGQQKTLDRIATRFYWPGVYQEVVAFCKSCPTCQLTSRSKRGMKAPLVNLPIIDVPFTRIAMDIVGPLDKSRAGHRYILVICDYATRYPEAFPLRNTKSRQVANSLIQLFSRVGIPREIITDQGTNFNSGFMKQVYSLLGIRGIRTTPYHPQTDGMVERFNQTLKAMLRKFVSDTGANWDQWLPYLLFAYREVPQASTGYSPFELLYGRQVRGPLDVLREAWMGEGTHPPANIVEYVLKMRNKLEELSSLAHDNLAQAQSNQKTWYDRTARSRTFNPGQKVLLLLPSSESSLLAKWQGPFEVLRKMGPVTYEVAMPDRRRPKQVFPH